MLGAYIVGVISGAIAALGTAYIIGKANEYPALPPYDPDNDPDED